MNSNSNYDTIIIGAGLSGLACALKLQDKGQRPLLLEKSDAPGGRVRTDEVEGFLLDRGFQVYLSAYPTAGALLDLEALDLRCFEPGALVRSSQKLHRVMDVFRRPHHLIGSALSPVGTVIDKLRVAKLRASSLGSDLDDIAQREDLSTEAFLRDYGFSEGMIDQFFRSFYGGIFLENDLRTSSRMFEFTFKMFSEGAATLPARGMQEIPRQLASRLPADDIQCNVEVVSMTADSVRLRDGRTFHGDQIVLAMPADSAKALVPSLQIDAGSWRSVCNLYFAAPESPLGEPTIALAGSSGGLINNVSTPSDLSPHYAPEGQALVSVSVLGLPEKEGLTERVTQELAEWFGPAAHQWRHLRTDRIKRALPEQGPGPIPKPLPAPPLYLCGDYEVSASIEGAIISGQRTAEAILARGTAAGEQPSKNDDTPRLIKTTS